MPQWSPCLSIRSTKEDKKMTEQLLANYYNNGVLSSILSGALLIMSMALISNFIKLIVPYTCISFFFSLKNMLRTHKVSLLPTGSFFISLFKFRLRWQLANCTLPITNIEQVQGRNKKREVKIHSMRSIYSNLIQ